MSITDPDLAQVAHQPPATPLQEALQRGWQRATNATTLQVPTSVTLAVIDWDHELRDRVPMRRPDERFIFLEIKDPTHRRQTWEGYDTLKLLPGSEHELDEIEDRTTRLVAKCVVDAWTVHFALHPGIGSGLSAGGLRCGACGRAGVRIYRPYANFYRPEDNRCNAHITEEQRGWYVPCVRDDDGTVWGYTSTPPEAGLRWKALPEADPTLPSPNV